MIDISLVGNPNTGKTTLYNAITKSCEHVGNWHGVTVDKKTSLFEYNDNTFRLVDLPGTYSLSSYSFEEQVTIDNILQRKSKIINLCDINAIERNLYLTLQLMEADVDFVLAINMVKHLDEYNHLKSKLSKILGNRVILCDGQSNLNVQELLQVVTNTNININNKLPYLEKFNELANCIRFNAKNEGLNEYFCAIKLCEYDKEIETRLKLNENQFLVVEKFRKKFSLDFIAKLRYDYINQILNIPRKSVYGVSKIDNLFLHRVFALPIFVLIMLGIFFITFDSLGAFLSYYLNVFIKDIVGHNLILFLQSVNVNIIFIDFINKCIINGIGGILAFLPQIALLFLFISILEESGYLSRLAFMFEDWLSKFGLSGKSVFTLIMGFGCTTTAMFTANNLEDKNAKIKTVLLTPYMSCSAKLPIYAVFCGAFFNQSIFMIFLLYFIGVFTACLLALILENSKLKSNEQSFILEFPAYRFPKMKNVIRNIYINVIHFVSKVGGMLLLFGILVWFLQSFTFDLQFAQDGKSSILKSISELFAPIFVPLGFGNWGAVSALLCGLVAKEIVVTTLAMINSVNLSNTTTTSILSLSLISCNSPIHFTGSSALSFMVFCLLYPPCISSMSVMKSQIGKKMTILGLLLQLTLAYIVSFFVYMVSNNFDYTAFIIISVVLVILLISLICINHHEKNNICQICKQKYCDMCYKIYK